MHYVPELAAKPVCLRFAAVLRLLGGCLYLRLRLPLGLRSLCVLSSVFFLSLLLGSGMECPLMAFMMLLRASCNTKKHCSLRYMLLVCSFLLAAWLAGTTLSAIGQPRPS